MNKIDIVARFVGARSIPEIAAELNLSLLEVEQAIREELIYVGKAIEDLHSHPELWNFYQSLESL